MSTTVEEKMQLNIDKSSWKLVKFGDVVFEPKAVAKNLQDEDIQHVVGLEHIDTEDIHLKRFASIEESTTFTKKFAKGDVLFGRRRAYLKKAAQAPFDGICSGDITVFRAKNDLLPALLPFVVNNDKFFDYAIKHSAGGLSPRVKFKDLANYEFLLPPKDQQAQLAELLWAMDEVVEREIYLLSRLKISETANVEDLLQGNRELVFNGKSFSLNRNESIKDSWRLFSIDELCHKVTDGEHLSPIFLEVGMPILSAKDIREEDIQIENSNFISKEAFEISRKRCDPEFNDVLIVSRGATIGRTTVNKLEIPFALMGSVILLKPNELILGDYLGMMIRRKTYQNKLLAISGSTAQQAIYLVDIKKSKILIPEINYQKLIVKYINLIKSRVKILEEKNKSSKVLQKSLINQIF